jgi:branched-chain amino acid transport system substrate-binding protein
MPANIGFARGGLVALLSLLGVSGALAQEDTASGDPIVFGGALPFTGWGSDAGEYNRRGYELWERHVNEDGGLLGRPVEVLIYDDASDPTTTARLYERLITEDEVDVLLAPWSDDMTMPATTVAERYGKPMVTGGATLDAIWDRGYEYVNGLLPSSYDYVGMPMRLIADQEGVETVAIANNELTYTTGFGDAAAQNAEELGLEILTREVYSAANTDFTAVLTKARSAEPDLFVGGTGGEDAIQILRQAEEVGLNPAAFYFTIAPVDPEFVRVLGDSAEYVFGTTEWEPSLTDLPGYDRFVDDYRAEFGEDPVEDVATSYGLVQVLAEAVEQVGEIDDAQIAEALRNLETQTVFGTYSVDPETGRQTGKEIYVVQILDGERHIVWPEEFATAEMRFPTPAWSER